MSDSDSDSDYAADWDWDFRDQVSAKHMSCLNSFPIFSLKDEAFERWSCISVGTRKQAAQRMKVCVFWLPILLLREENESSSFVDWALQIGLIDFINEDLNLKHLQKIEAVETVLRALERGTLKRDQTKQFIRISQMFTMNRPDVLEKALNWLDQTEEPSIRQRVVDLGHVHTRFTALQLIFIEFAKYICRMGNDLENTMGQLMAKLPACHIEKCEEMKRRGNENFQRKQYDNAVKFYNEAIKYYPDNHIIYGNRALCYIRCEKYLSAVGDGKRATLIEPLWAKGHYRYCEALFYLGEVRMAIEANSWARSLCKDDHEGMKDLEQQHHKFITETAQPNAGRPKKSQSKRAQSAGRPHAAEAQPASNPTPHSKVSHNKMDKKPGKNERTAHAESGAKESKSSKSEFSKNGKGEPSAAAKKKSKQRNQAEYESERADDSNAALRAQLRSVVQDAHAALTDLRSRNAEQAFSQALALLETTTPKDLGLSTLDVLLLLYGRASALTEIGLPEELGEAQRLLERIRSFEERTFQCLVFYAVGRVYVKENRFAVALEQFSDSLQMVKNQITPGKLTWPLTKEIVIETQPDSFKQILQSAIDLCRFPPIPDAICRLQKGHGHLKAEIYFTDPDFKGFIQMSCCQRCIVEYHMTCWKSLKVSSFSEKNEKDFLQDPCLTPDCVGQICCIKIFGPTGLVKCKFEAAIPKAPISKRPKVNQKCTSLKKLKSKEERHVRRKQRKQMFEEKRASDDENLQKKEDSASQLQQKAWLLYRDRVLLQISQNLELLREERSLHVPDLISCLKPWLTLDSYRGNRLALRILCWDQEQLETVAQVVELLLERKNRVWARVLVQLLSSCRDINPKLYNWACQLDSAGLNAARLFIERYSEHLEQLDLAFLLSFDPLQEAPPQDMRLFIWALEEHRDQYESCHSILDNYFDMMDGHCSVLKKSDENQNNSPMRSRGRKKKPKEPKGVIVWSGTRSVTPRDERDHDFFEDESLSFLHPAEPFSVPGHLREQVAHFEDQYYSTRHTSHYQEILDNNPDTTEETLYDYFAQILEEHGPLVAEDPLLVGELENFPAEAQLKIQKAGGFEPFLLESLRFIKIGRSIGLTQHADSLLGQQQGVGGLDDLDDLDVVVDPHANPPAPAFTSYLDSYPCVQSEMCPILPNPYAYNPAPAPPFSLPVHGVSYILNDPVSHWIGVDGQQQVPYFFHNNYGQLELCSAEAEGGVWACDPPLAEVASVTAESFLKSDAAVQTCQEAMRSVAVNTELHERFESCQGDLNKKQKSNTKLEKHIEKMANGCDKVSVQHKEDLAVLEEDLQKITANIQVTNKELALFQQKLEEEVKTDQKEKKANQEALRCLKVETEELVEEHGRLAQSVREKKAEYDAKLSDFLELSNQLAAEKMSLEDEIKRCKALFASATRRSRTAQLSVVESSRDQGLYGLCRELTNAKTLLSKLDEAAHRYPNQDLETERSTWKATIQDLETKISSTEAQFQEQMDAVKSGRRVGEFPSVSLTKQPEAPAAPPSGAADQLVPPSSSSRSSSPTAARPVAAAPSAPPPAQHRPPPRTAEPPHGTVFNKAMEHLSAIFPDCSRSDMMRFIQELRSSSGGSLSSMELQDVVGGVTQLILDHQEKHNSAKVNMVGRGSPAPCATPPPVAPVWQTVTAPRATHANALNVEDPCIICHDDMSPDDTCVLECRHSFHNECIRSWLKEQSTCPTCRDHALLPEDFPMLPGRRRQAL